MLKVKDLVVRYGMIEAIKGISFEVNDSEIVTLIGANGAGKTTTMHTISGLIKAASGSIELDGKDISKIPAHKIVELGISQCPERRRVFALQSVEDNLLLGVAQNRIEKSFLEQSIKPYQKKLEGILVKTGLKDHRHKKAEDLSYGQRKLLEIGRALMQEADIYIFDEPFTGLSPKMVEEVLSIIDILRVEAKTVILIEHNMSLIEQLSDYIIVLDHGTLLASGAPKDVLNNKLVQEAYLGV